MIDATLRQLRRIDFGDLLRIEMLADGSSIYTFEHGRVWFTATGPRYELEGDEEALVAYAPGQPRDWHGRFAPSHGVGVSAPAAGADQFDAVDLEAAFVGDQRVNVHPEDLTRESPNTWSVDHNGLRIVVTGNSFGLMPGNGDPDGVARIADAVSVAWDVKPLPDVKQLTVREDDPPFGHATLGWTDYDEAHQDAFAGRRTIHISTDRATFGETLPGEFSPAHVILDRTAESEQRYHGEDTGIVIHEYGHLVDFAYGPVHETFDNALRRPPPAARHLGTYASGTTAEYDAESFAEWVLSSGNTGLGSVKTMAKKYDWAVPSPASNVPAGQEQLFAATAGRSVT